MSMKVVDFGRPGGPEFLLVKEAPKPPCQDCQILIQVAATGLNCYDTFDRKHVPRVYTYKPISSLGYECSGKVVAVGLHVSTFKEGDEVCAILEGGGGCAEFICVNAYIAQKIPRGITLAQAASLPLASCLTLYALSLLKNIDPGNTILIHGDAGGIDTIAIQYAKYILRCEVIAVAGMEEKLRLYKMLGADVCINYKKQDFCKFVKAETGERGVNFILDAGGTDHFLKNLDCLAIGGSLIILGYKPGSCVDIDLSVLMHKDITVIGGDFRYLFYSKIRSILTEVATKIWPLIEAGDIKPIIGKEFSFSEATEAYRAFSEHSIAGKILLVSQCDIKD